MPDEAASWSDERMDLAVGRLLQVGVALAAAVVLAGGGVYLVRSGSSLPQYRAFHGEPNYLRTLPGIVAEALRGTGRGIIQLGLVLLVATPVARVAFSVILFLLQRDYLYVGVTLIVLSLLLFSIFGGL